MASSRSKTPARRRPRALLVLGMHRSGTSALARVLGFRGAEMPRHLLPANAGNPEGYWEPQPVVDFNDRLLAYFGVDWDDPFATLQLPPSDAIPDRFRTEAVAIVREEFGGNELVVLKDPRCTLLPGFWCDVLGDAGFDASPIVMARPFEEVADSLRRRDGTPMAGGVLLSVAYGMACLAFVDRHPRTPVVTYASLLSDWAKVTDAIAHVHGFNWPRGGAAVGADVEAFLVAGPARVATGSIPERLEAWSRQVWQALVARADGRPVPPVGDVAEGLAELASLAAPVVARRSRKVRELEAEVERLAQVESRLHGMFEESQASLEDAVRDRDRFQAERDAALARAKALEGEKDALAGHLAGRDAEVADLQRGVSELQSRHDALEREKTALAAHLAARDAEVVAMQAGIAELQGRHDAAEREKAALAGHLAARDAEVADMQGGIAALQSRHDALEREKAALAKHLAARDAEVAGMQAGIAALQSRHDALEREKADLARHLAARDAEVAGMQAGIATLQSQLDALGQEKAALAGHLSARDAEVAELQAENLSLRETRDSLARDGEQLREDVARREAEVSTLRRDLEAAEGERHHLQVEHERLCTMHEDALLRLDRTEDRARQLEAAFSRTSSELAMMQASRSWRLTGPLRLAGTAVRKALGREAAPRAAQRLLPPPAAVPAPAPAAAAGQEDEARANGTPAWAPASHDRLRAFLHEEFGAAAVDETVARINTYRLPVEVGDGRVATDTSCPADEARGLMRAIAERAACSSLSGEAPDVSVVVPVYGQLRHTLACLDALVGHRTRYRFEVLVGDDASPDATAEAFEVPIPGIRHVRHPSNLGFVRNCNETAAQARGRLLVFLNNDTLVLPGWLDELAGTLDSDPDIGLAGSKLVYPDGRLQESGAIVWRDGSAWNFGRFDDPRRPEYCYLRDVDYVSGASIALSRQLWDALGGFDEAFVPAYAEDADLAFRVRASGKRTVVQPLSQVLHFEGVSSGTDTGQGAKAHQVENLRKLHERWRHVLETHRPNAESPELEKERGVDRRVLFIDHVTPTPHADAGSLVAWEVMSAFRALGYKVTFIPEDNFAHVGPDTAALQRVGIEPIYHPAYTRMNDFLKARHDPFDVVFLHRYGVGHAHLAAMRRHFPGARIVFLNADMHFLREMREAEVTGDVRAREAALDTRERELAVVRGADCALVHSEVELAMLEEACPGTGVRLFPLVQDPVEGTPGLAGRAGVCFIGGFRHPPNVDGVLWFVREAWPRVRARLPEATFHIAGSNMPPEVLALGGRDGVEVAGFVDDLAGFLAARRATVAPLRYGAGAKGKVASALAHGVPTAGTAIAMEGMGLETGRDVLVADDPDGLADALVALLEDDVLWTRLRAASLDFARRVTARCHARQRMAAILDQVGAPGGPSP